MNTVPVVLRPWADFHQRSSTRSTPTAMWLILALLPQGSTIWSAWVKNRVTFYQARQSTYSSQLFTALHSPSPVWVNFTVRRHPLKDERKTIQDICETSECENDLEGVWRGKGDHVSCKCTPLDSNHDLHIFTVCTVQPAFRWFGLVYASWEQRLAATGSALCLRRLGGQGE